MSNYEQRNGQGSIFKNDYKKQDNHPDYRGKGKDLQGNYFEISLWVKKTRDGKPFFSFQMREPYDAGAAPKKQDMPKSSEFDDDDQLPF